MTEPTDGEAAEPFHAKLLWAGTLPGPADGVPGGFEGTFTALSDEMIADRAGWNDSLRGTIYGPNPLFTFLTPWVRPNRNPMPHFVPFPRVAAAERFVRRQRSNVSEARRRVNTAVDVLLHGDTGDW